MRKFTVYGKSRAILGSMHIGLQDMRRIFNNVCPGYYDSFVTECYYPTIS